MALLKRIINKDLFSKIMILRKFIHVLRFMGGVGGAGDLHGREDLRSGSVSSTVSILMECMACLIGLNV